MKCLNSHIRKFLPFVGCTCILIGLLVLILEIKVPGWLAYFDEDIGKYLEEYYVGESQSHFEHETMLIPPMNIEF